eukprot:CAMPEP_0114987044 /NCGR_PEP_ID=MMETSP0216-20121206/8780_1 /TAXON_ID=223996 /ORGANISM="Protocruzia adherens, Strain Boccale" /LENGTH=240 /DNA_ID=CAMNT_0002349581 /DNA_START=31 /DNA_END=753 /DNA_ORIENTATION=-
MNFCQRGADKNAKDLSSILANRDKTDTLLEKTEGSAFRWNPLVIGECTCKNCVKEKRFLAMGLQSLISRRVQPILERNTDERAKAQKLSTDYQCYNELDRIVNAEFLTSDEKMKLISTPSSSSVARFVKQMIGVTDATSQLITYTAILLERFLTKTNHELYSTTWRILLLLAFNIALKYEGHQSFLTSELQQLNPLFKKEEFASLELLFLNKIDFKLSTSLHEVHSYTNQLEKLANSTPQ